MTRLVLALLLLMGVAGAQVTYAGLVGTGQTVPDPFFTGGPSGTAVLSGFYCGSGTFTGLNFTVFGLPLGYNTGPAVTQEAIYWVIDAGASSLPGVPVAGGIFYVPFTPAATVLGGNSSVYLGPADIVPCPGLVPLPGPAGTFTTNGARINLGTIPPGTFGALTVQGFLFDPALGRFFTTNAINITIP